MRNPTTGIMVNVGIFVNITNPKNIPESKMGIMLLLLPLPSSYLSGEESFL
jgi:hypothetical protein